MRRIFLFASVLGFLTAETEVQAQPQPSGSTAPGIPTEPTAATPPAVSHLVEKADRAHEIGHWDEAIESYAQAYQISGNVDLLFRLAETHREAGHDADAARIFRNYLRRAPQGSNRATAETQIKAIEQRMRGAEVARPSGAVAAPTRPQQSVGPVTTLVPPSAVAPSSASAVAPPSASASTSRSAEPDLAQAEVVAPKPAEAPAVVVSRPVVAAPSGAPQPAVDLSVVAGGPAESQAPLPRWLPWTLSAAAVALGTTAIVSGLSASHRFDDLQSSCGQTAGGCTPEQISDVKSRARVANVLWALTGVAAVGAGVTIYANTHTAGLSGLWSF